MKQKEPPQKYRLGMISNTKLLAGLNRFYMAITSPSASAVVHNTQPVLRSPWRIPNQSTNHQEQKNKS